LSQHRPTHDVGADRNDRVEQDAATVAAHAILRRWNISLVKPRRFGPDFPQITPKFRLCTNTALPHFCALHSFVARDQSVAAAMPAAHDLHAKFGDPARNGLRRACVLC
jgi:hypothetical protein